MRKIAFRENELLSLIEIIKLGNSQYENEFPKIGELILNKIKIEIFTFSTKEIQIFTAIRKSKIKRALESRIFDFAKQIILYGTLQAKQKYQKTSY